MRTDVRIILGTFVVLFLVAAWLLAAGMVFACFIPFGLLCALCHHIDRNRAYYDGQLDDLYGKDDELK